MTDSDQPTQDCDAWIDYARDQIQRQDYSGATESLRRALSIDPDNARGHALMALTLLEQKRLDAARSEAAMAIALAPEDDLSHYAAGSIAMARRDFSQAIEHFELCIKIDPDYAPYYVALAKAYTLAPNREIRPDLLDKALALDPEDADVRVAYGFHLYNEGKLAEAEAFLRETLAREPEHVDSLVLLGELRLRQDDTEGAREHALAALSINASDPDALSLIASIKARGHPFLGLWWRFMVWIDSRGDLAIMGILLLSYAIYRVAVQSAHDAGVGTLAVVIQILWLIVVAYTWSGPLLFNRMLAKELRSVELKKEF